MLSCETVDVHVPRQKRSIASTNRMLDAAEELLAEFGSDALTVEAVVSRANTSNGAFFARFGNREGLLLAMQDRFLARLETESTILISSENSSDDLYGALYEYVSHSLAIFLAHRNAFKAMMIQNLDSISFRQRGNRATTSGVTDLTKLIRKYSHEISHRDIALAADVAFRVLFAVSTQRVMLDEGEITGNRFTEETWNEEVTDLLYRYLTA